jgi:hypothetical protein
MDGLRMRRRLTKFLPIVMIALMVQIFAPIAACWAAAITASDPLGTATICRDTSGAADQQGGQGVPQHQHGAACSLCCLAGTGAGLDTPKLTVLASPQRAIVPVAWCDRQANNVAAFRTGSNAQARAPPFSS